jgi:hypothetical protein
METTSTTEKGGIPMRLYVRLLLMSAWFLSVMTLSAWAAEEGTVRATSSWVADGRYYEIKEDQALFVGAFAGVMFVETKTGAMDSAQLLCPAMVEVNLTDGTQSGEGRCIITTRSNDKVYATWRCAGEHGTGCAGTFSLTGGTGRFTGITGSSAFEVRSQYLALAAKPGDTSVQGSAAGVAVWPALTYKIP